jgi:tetratricopeptide (TPR) repeat protein
MMAHATKPLNGKMEVSAERITETEWVGNATPFTLVQADNFLKTSPDDVELLVTAAQLYHGYAFAFFEDTDKKRAGELYKKARGYALRALEQNEVFKNALNQTTEDFVQALNTFDKKDVPALYFAANSWLSWIGVGNTEALADISKVLAMIDRVIELDDEFNYGGIHALRGAWLASRPKMFGGKPEEAKFHFDEAIKISESKYLFWQLLYAKYYAVQTRDRQLFVTTLEKIISAPKNLFPEKNFDNVIAKQKAKVLLAKVDEYFRPKRSTKRGGP